MYSKNFSFSPGFGLPGRVYLSRIPSWEKNLCLLKPEQFARVGGAKVYGLNTCLCIPINTPIGIIVVGLYSTQNLNRDVVWEKKCMEYLWKLKPEPKWKLTIDVGLKSPLSDTQGVPARHPPASSPRISSSRPFVIPPPPTASKNLLSPVLGSPALSALSSTSSTDRKPSDLPLTAPHVWNEQSLALLIGKYMPINHNSAANQVAQPSTNNQDFADNLMSLRLLLLRQPPYRTNAESKLVDTIMRKYRSYGASNKEHDLIMSIVNDWKQMSSKPFRYSQGPGPATKRVFNDTQPTHDRTNSLSMQSPLPASFIASVAQNNPSHQFTGGENYNRSVSAYNGDNGSQNIAAIASSISEHILSQNDQFVDQNHVPRVVSEQGPIAHN